MRAAAAEQTRAKLIESGLLLAERLGWEPARIHTTFQSVFGREEWLRPYTIEHVADLGREGRSVAVISPAFAADWSVALEGAPSRATEALDLYLHALGVARARPEAAPLEEGRGD